MWFRVCIWLGGFRVVLLCVSRLVGLFIVLIVLCIGILFCCLFFYLIVGLFGIVVLFNCCTSEFGACFDFVLRIVLMYCLLV